MSDGPRREDVEAKQQFVAELLGDLGADGLLLLDPANVRWLTAGAESRGLHAPEEEPALFYTAESRWLLCGNADSARIFDEQIDGLGFQLKEWAWLVGKRRLLDDLTRDRRALCDRPFGQFDTVGDRLKRRRLRLTQYTRERLRELGRSVAHAVEATARNLSRGDSEQEAAGQLGHRLLHHGIDAVAAQVASDDRAATYRRCGATDKRIDKGCFLLAVGGRDGLFASAARTVRFGEPDAQWRSDHDAAVRLLAAYSAGSRPGVPIGKLFEACREQVADERGEAAWRSGPPGYLTGHAPAEAILGNRPAECFEEHQAVVWQACVGGALVCDTALIGPDGSETVTPTDEWPYRITRIGDHEYRQPEVLVRRDEG